MSQAARSSWAQMELEGEPEAVLLRVTSQTIFTLLRCRRGLQTYFCLPAIPAEALDAWDVDPKLRPRRDREGSVFPYLAMSPKECIRHRRSLARASPKVDFWLPIVRLLLFVTASLL